MNPEDIINILSTVSCGLSTLAYIIFLCYILKSKIKLQYADKLVVILSTSDFMNVAFYFIFILIF